MEMSERERHIKVLEKLLLHYKAREMCEGYYDNTLKDYVEALEYAISSLKTDEAYQLMYEGGEIFTKDEVAAMLTELQSNILELKSYESADGQDLVMLSDIGTLFHQKINNLKEADK